jgi:pyridoxal phosphate enzyme (YggS family)
MNLPAEPENSLPDSDHILGRIQSLRQEMGDLCRQVGRDPASVRIVAVTKTHPLRAMVDAIHGGLMDLGENRVQEFLPKIQVIRDSSIQTPGGDNPVFHLIGHLQTNKAKQVVAAGIDLVHSVDSLELARELDKRAGAAGRVQDILLQVNVSGEESKSGMEPELLDPTLGQIVPAMGHLRVVGLMTMAPFEMEADQTRPVFAGLRELLAKASAQYSGAPNFHPQHLSMGMTNDWRQAVTEGATLIRVGSALFGPR